MNITTATSAAVSYNFVIFILVGDVLAIQQTKKLLQSKKKKKTTAATKRTTTLTTFLVFLPKPITNCTKS